MKKLLIASLAVLGSLTATAQFPKQGGRVLVSAYGSYVIPFGSIIPASGSQTVTFPGPTFCYQSAGQRNFTPISTLIPLKIVDAVAANTETVTPSAVNVTAATCSFTATFANPHGSYTVQSGTGGLQEAIIDNASSGAVLVLDPQSTTTTANITAATGGSATLSIEDLRNGTPTYYQWNGSAFANHAGLPAAQADILGTLNLASGAATLTFNKPFNSAPVCIGTDQTGANAVKISTTASAATFAGTTTDIVAYACWGNPR